MNDPRRPTFRPRVLLSAALRLGCALLACAGIAAARGASAPADEAAALRLTFERQVAAVLDAARETGAAWASPASLGVRQARSARPDPRRSAPAAASASVSASASFRALDFAPSTALSASFRAPGSSSPRGPPASA